jgi:hypothetical protein
MHEKLDRTLATTEWEEKYLKATVNALSRDISDHTPLLLNSGDTMAPKGPPLFKFELGLLLCDGFAEMVKGVRTNETRGNTPMEK